MSRQRATPKRRLRSGQLPSGCSRRSTIRTGPSGRARGRSNATLHRLGWTWAPLIGARLERPERRRADAVLAPQAMGGSRRTAAAAGRHRRCGRARARLERLTGRAEAREGQRAMAEAVGGLFAPKRAQGRAEHAARRSGHRDRQDARLSRAGVAVGGTVRRHGVGLDLHQGAAAAARRRGTEAVRRRGGAGAADRRAQGPRELSVPAQPRGCAAGRLRRAGGDSGAAGRALGGLHQGRRHGRRRLAGLAAEPVPPRRRDRAHRSARRMRLCRLPALSPLLHRARRAGEPRGRHRHRQPCAGDGQCGAALARTRRGRILFDEGHHLFDAADFDLRGRVRRAGGDRAPALDRRPGRPLARAAARARGAADGRRLL